jgi:D-amino peptidase
MRVYLSIDMEGIAGVVHADQTNPIDPRCAGEYGRFRRLMTMEANAAIEGALTGGATRVLVNDSHWTMRNILAEELHEGAELLSGGPKTWSMMEGIEAGWDLAAFIGYHAKAGTANAILDHTYTDRILDVRLNGTSVGELGINAALAGAFGVPVALVTGDKALGVEARALLGDRIQTIAVKEAVSQYAARHLSPETARALIRDSMRETVEDARRHGVARAKRYVLQSPITIEVDFSRTIHADHASMAPGILRTAPRTVSARYEDFREVFRAFRTMFNLAGLD